MCCQAVRWQRGQPSVSVSPVEWSILLLLLYSQRSGRAVTWTFFLEDAPGSNRILFYQCCHLLKPLLLLVVLSHPDSLQVSCCSRSGAVQLVIWWKLTGLMVQLCGRSAEFLQIRFKFWKNYTFKIYVSSLCVEIRIKVQTCNRKSFRSIVDKIVGKKIFTCNFSLCISYWHLST